MPDKPAAERVIDEALVRKLVVRASEVVPDARDVPIRHVADGWDCSVWSVGAALALRVPRRALADGLLHHEAQALPLVGPAIEATGVRVPIPVFAADASDRHPWPWSVVPWIDGAAGLTVPRAERATWAAPLARALGALHVPAPPDHPHNPVRGVPLAIRDVAVRRRLAGLRDSGGVQPDLLDRAETLWARGLAAPAWRAPDVWIHGDLHPGNLVADGGGLAGIIDFGDVTGGDPAYDLAVAWLAFDAAGRASFIDACEDRYDAPTWIRARAWAAAASILLLSQADDDPAYGSLGTESLVEVSMSEDC